LFAQQANTIKPLMNFAQQTTRPVCFVVKCGTLEMHVFLNIANNNLWKDQNLIFRSVVLLCYHWSNLTQVAGFVNLRVFWLMRQWSAKRLISLMEWTNETANVFKNYLPQTSCWSLTVFYN